MWHLLNAVLAQAQEAAPPPDAAGQQPANPMGSMFFMILAFGAIMYFMMIRPNQRREKERREMLAALAKGDRVVTTGGIYGTIVGVSEKSVVLRVDDDSNVKMEFLRGAVNQVVSRGQD